MLKHAQINGNKLFFMNMGYKSAQDKLPTLYLSNELITFEHDMYRANLYYKLAEYIRDLNIKPQLIIEIGSGLGGGVFLYNKMFNPEKSIGIDISTKLLDYASSMHKLLNNGSQIFFSRRRDYIENRKASIVVCLEMSFHVNLIKLLKQIDEYIQTDGYLLFGDLFQTNQLEEIEKTFYDKGYKIVREIDVTSEVLEAIKEPTIYEDGFKWFFKMLLVFTKSNASEGSLIYNKMKNKTLIYKLYTFQKLRINERKA